MAHAETRPERRTPFYFEAAGRSLFGCYHEPAAGARHSAAVVLCYPFGQEYLRVHRSFIQLASRLAGSGFPVLRFDYSGSGDSAGAGEDATVERWVADIGAAVEEARRRSGAERVSLVGLRLGASLAALAAAPRGDVYSLVLWDPVVQGSAYLEELRELQEENLRYAYVTPEADATGQHLAEVLGFPVSAAFREGIAGIDLLRLEAAPADRVLLVESEATPEVGELLAHLSQPAVLVEHEHLDERKVWLKEPLQGIVPHRLLEAIVSWLSRVHA